MVQSNLFYTLFTKYKSRPSKGVNREKHLHTNERLIRASEPQNYNSQCHAEFWSYPARTVV